MQNKKSDPKEDKELVIATRTWLCLYLFEHQYVVHNLSFLGCSPASLLGFLMGPDVQLY